MTTPISLPKVVCSKISLLLDPKYGGPCTRSSHGLSLIANGSRLILYGGEHVARTPLEDPIQALWAADLRKKNDDDGSGDEWQWRCLPLGSSSTSGPSPLPPPRVAHAQAAAIDGATVYVFGGRAGIDMKEKAMNDLWKLDASNPGDETWTLVEPSSTSPSPPPEPRSFHRMICVKSSLYVFGGCGANGRLADLHRFDLEKNTWHNLGSSHLLRGRGGPNFLPLSSGSQLAVVAGFAGEETNDGHCYDLSDDGEGKWKDESLEEGLRDMRPRSVCVCSSFPSVGVSIIFGGEVDPSERGHEGAGGFENDVVVLDESSGTYLGRIPAPEFDGEDSLPNWPITRGWSDSSSIDRGDGTATLFLFGGLSGNDENPMRLDDLWRLDIQKTS